MEKKSVFYFIHFFFFQDTIFTPMHSRGQRDFYGIGIHVIVTICNLTRDYRGCGLAVSAERLQFIRL